MATPVITTQPSTPTSPTKRIYRNAALALLLACAVISPVFQLKSVHKIIPSRWSDLYSPWVGIHSALHGVDPYSAAVTREIQTSFYGRPLRPGEAWDRQSFVYPAHLVILLAPLAFLRWHTVRLGFIITLPLLVAVSAWLWVEACCLSFNRRRLAIILTLVTCSWPAVWAYQQQQPTVLILAIAAIACLLLKRGRDVPAGILLAVATVKPQLVMPLILWILIWVVVKHRWRLIAAFTFSLVGLLAAAEAVIPGWMAQWYVATTVYSHDPHKPPLLILLLGHQLGIACMLLLGALVLFRLWKVGAVAANSREFGIGIALILSFTVCVIPSTKWMIYNQLALVPAILVLLNERPTLSPARVLRKSALAATLWTLLMVPFCAAMIALIGYSPLLAILPFCNCFLPPLVAIALLPNREGHAVRLNQSNTAAVSDAVVFTPQCNPI